MEEVTNPLAEFPPEVRIAVDGLIHLGELEEEVEFCGHTFSLRTLRAGEEIAASAVIQNLRGTIKEPDAWAAAQVASALTSIDGETDFCPQAGPDAVSNARGRYNYLVKNWYWPTIHFLFQFYGTLLDKQIEAVRQFQDLSARGPHTFSPSGDSFSEPGTLSEQIALETQNSPS